MPRMYDKLRKGKGMPEMGKGRVKSSAEDKAQMLKGMKSAAATPPAKTEAVDVNWPKIEGREWDQPSRG